MNYISVEKIHIPIHTREFPLTRWLKDIVRGVVDVHVERGTRDEGTSVTVGGHGFHTKDTCKHPKIIYIFIF